MCIYNDIRICTVNIIYRSEKCSYIHYCSAIHTAAGIVDVASAQLSILAFINEVNYNNTEIIFKDNKGKIIILVSQKK